MSLRVEFMITSINLKGCKLDKIVKYLKMSIG